MTTPNLRPSTQDDLRKDDLRKIIGRNLVTLRIAKHGPRDIRKHQYAIASNVGLSGSQYQKYEQGTTGYYMDKLASVASYFGVTLAYLMTDNSNAAAQHTNIHQLTGMAEAQACFTHEKSPSEELDIALEIIKLFQQIPQQSDRDNILRVLKGLKA